VKAPALFRQSFYVFANLPGQVMSYNKMLGQLQDKGNIDLVKYYLELFEGAFLFKKIQKFTLNEVLKKQSSPKIITLAPCLNTFHRFDNLTSEYMGRVFESAVGAQLVRFFESVFYWAEGDYEVDFVIKHRREIIVIEVKSGRNKKSVSLEKFRNKYPDSKVLFITKDNYADFEEDPVSYIENFAT
jgi:predicted AAA+ superfamily ATPase